MRTPTFLLLLLASSSQLTATETIDLWPQELETESGWARIARANGNPGCQAACECADRRFAVSDAGRPWLTAQHFTPLPDDRVVTRVVAQVLARFNDDTKGRVRLRVEIPSLGIVKAVSSARFKSTKDCKWRFGRVGDVTDLVPVWTPELLADVRVSVRRFTRTNSTPLRVKGFRLRVTTELTPCECQSVTPSHIDFGFNGGSRDLSIELNHATCSPVVAADDSWVRVSNRFGRVNIGVSRNPAASRRSTMLRAFGCAIPITQEASPCFLALDRDEPFVASNAETTFSVRLSRPIGCPWVVDGPLPGWLTLANGTTGDRGGLIRIRLSANSSGQTRQYELTIRDRNDASIRDSLLIEQRGEGCAYTVAPAEVDVPAEGGAFDVSVNTFDSCSWTPTSNQDWLRIGVSSSKRGSGGFQVRVGPNPSTRSRRGSIRVGSTSIRVSQSGQECRPQVSHPAIHASASGGTYRLGVTTPLACSWSVSERESFVSIGDRANTSGGSGWVDIVLTENSSTSRREGEISVSAGRTSIRVPVYQAAAECRYTVSQSPIEIPHSDAQFAVRVTTAYAFCEWSVSAAAHWLRVDGSTSRVGSGTVRFVADTNSSIHERSTTIVVAGARIRVHQSGSGILWGGRISVKALTDSSGSRDASGFAASRTQIEAAIAEANWVLRNNGLEWGFYLDEIVDLEAPEFMTLDEEGTLFFGEDLVVYPDELQWREDALNIYIVDRFDENCESCSPTSASGSSRDYVLLSSERGVVGGGSGWLREIARVAGIREVEPCTDPGCAPFACPLFEVSREDGSVFDCEDVCPGDGNALVRSAVNREEAWLSDCQVEALEYALLNPQGRLQHIKAEFDVAAPTSIDLLQYRPGDVNVDAAFNITDPVGLLSFLFGGAEMDCLAAAEVNDDSEVNVADAVTMLSHLFGGGSQIAAPGPQYCTAASQRLECDYDRVDCPEAEVD